MLAAAGIEQQRFLQWRTPSIPAPRSPEVSMSGSAPQTVPDQIGHEDYSLRRVPDSVKYSWWVMLVQRFAQLSALTQFMIGATLGMGMTFWSAVITITLGSVI